MNVAQSVPRMYLGRNTPAAYDVKPLPANDLPRASGQDRTDDRLARVIGAQPWLFAIPLASAAAEQRRTGGDAAKTRIESVPKVNLSQLAKGWRCR
jgi:hypothetical protein